MLTVQDIESIALNTYYKLVKKYNIVNCNFSLTDTVDYVINCYNYSYKRHCNTPKRMYNAIVYDLYDLYGSFARSEFYKKDDDIYYNVIIPIDNLYKLLYRIAVEYKYEVTDSELTEYISLVIQHEIGHILHYIAIFDEKGIDDGIEYLNSRFEDEFNDYLDYINEYEENEEYENTSDYELQNLYIKKYYNMYLESEANRYTNIDVKRFSELEIKVHVGLTPEYNIL